MSRIRAVTAALLACCVLPASAGAAESVALHTSFAPDRLGASTTIGFGFQITDPAGGLPAPLSSLSLRLPAGIDYVTTTLGLAICQPANLLAHGLAGCSPNSRLGFGSALVEVPFGTGSGQEIPEIQALMGPPHEGNIVVLFYANGQEPVYAQIVFQGELVSGSSTLGGSLNAAVPLIPSVPNGPPVSILNVQSTIGPSHLTYYTHAHGRTIAFHPKGVSVPEHCPKGGFQFSATFGFTDGTSAVAKSVVPCPSSRGRS
ncbi:MAG TPA: hypothetical protein VGL54_05630 [Solirubrobacteraceae bacterium]|jgi:hypothetical protein